jgi:hypothetical protein
VERKQAGLLVAATAAVRVTLRALVVAEEAVEMVALVLMR